MLTIVKHQRSLFRCGWLRSQVSLECNNSVVSRCWNVLPTPSRCKQSHRYLTSKYPSTPYSWPSDVLLIRYSAQPIQHISVSQVVEGQKYLFHHTMLSGLHETIRIAVRAIFSFATAPFFACSHDICPGDFMLSRIRLRNVLVLAGRLVLLRQLASLFNPSQASRGYSSYRCR